MKKLLALVLALVMTLGLATVGANAAATKYADADKISYKEAVDVMTAIGVLAGDETGFRPTDTLKRSEGAKIVAYLLLGNKAAEAMVGSGNRFTDLPANHWAAGYMEYLASQGVMGGVGGGKIDPDGQLTATAFAKMLLVALGYDAEIEGFGGDDWSINVQKIANQVGLFDGNRNAAPNAAVTREEAALYSFNTIRSPLVHYTNKGSSVEVNGAKIAFGASEAEYVISNAKAEQTIYADTLVNSSDSNPRYIVEFAEKYYPDLKLEGNDYGADDFGRPTRTWLNNNTEIGEYVQTAGLSVTGAVGTLSADGTSWTGTVSNTANITASAAKTVAIKFTGGQTATFTVNQGGTSHDVVVTKDDTVGTTLNLTAGATTTVIVSSWHGAKAWNQVAYSTDDSVAVTRVDADTYRFTAPADTKTIQIGATSKTVAVTALGATDTIEWIADTTANGIHFDAAATDGTTLTNGATNVDIPVGAKVVADMNTAPSTGFGVYTLTKTGGTGAGLKQTQGSTAKASVAGIDKFDAITTDANTTALTLAKVDEYDYRVIAAGVKKADDSVAITDVTLSTTAAANTKWVDTALYVKAANTPINVDLTVINDDGGAGQDWAADHTYLLMQSNDTSSVFTYPADTGEFHAGTSGKASIQFATDPGATSTVSVTVTIGGTVITDATGVVNGDSTDDVLKIKGTWSNAAAT